MYIFFLMRHSFTNACELAKSRHYYTLSSKLLAENQPTEAAFVISEGSYICMTSCL